MIWTFDVEEPDAPDCDGACFDRAALPEIFGSRTGWGPMRVAWDTNILIDYARYLGRAEAGSYKPPAGLDRALAVELAGLNSFMSLWMVRDIRIYVTGPQFEDGRLGARRRELREHQLEQIVAALECICLEPPGQLIAPPQAPYWVVPSTLKEVDRRIVSEAVRLECDVLLTRDKGILGHRRQLNGLGLEPMRPSEWAKSTAEERARGIVGCAHGWLMPDTHKWQHLDAARSVLKGG